MCRVWPLDRGAGPPDVAGDRGRPPLRDLLQTAPEELDVGGGQRGTPLGPHVSVKQINMGNIMFRKRLVTYSDMPTSKKLQN